MRPAITFPRNPCPLGCLRPNDIAKTQVTRLMDVFLLGPFMVYSAVKLEHAGHRVLATLMAASGWGVIAYNAHNYNVLRKLYGRLP